MSRKILIPVALALGWALPPSVYAMGLGPLIVLSGPGEPLRAEILIKTSHPDELASASAQLAEPSAYAMVHLPISPATRQWTFSIRKGSNPAILISGPAPVGPEPIPFLAQLDWASGQLVREYQVTEPTNIASRAVSSTAIDTLPSTGAMSARRTTSWANVERYGPVPKGTSLFDIAKQINRDPRITQQQAMAAIFRANPQAFLSGNPDELTAGALLRIPSKSEALSLSPTAAAALLHRREATGSNTGWSSSKVNSQASQAPAGVAPAAQTSSTTPTKSNSVEMASAFSLASASTASSASTAGTVSASPISQENDRLNALSNKVKMLEAQLRSQQAQLNMQVATVGQLSRTNGTGFSPLVILSLAINLLLLALFTWMYRRQRATARRQIELDDKIRRLQTGEKRRSGPTTMPDSASPAAASASGTSKTATSGNMAPPLGAGQDRAESSANSRQVPKIATKQAAPSVMPSFSVSSAGADGGEIAALEKELEAHPNQRATFVKLLELYSREKQKDKFLDLAERMRGRFGPMNEDWLRIARMGRDLFPGHPLFAEELPTNIGTSQSTANTSPIHRDLEPTVDTLTAPLDFPTGTSSADKSEPSPALSLDEEHSFGTNTPNTSSSWLDPLVEAFGNLDAQGSATAGVTPGASVVETKVGGSEEKIDFPSLSFGTEAKQESAAPAELASTGLDPDWDTIGTKLDLAKAYMELGDKEAALELLQEVQKIGNPSQRDEAVALIGSLQ
ncbi:MAG: hypothetical protein JJ714_07145 [Acidithiobacillus sp.]|nr:hypothetical protein [Acidithiobacillus sp.]